MSDAEADNALAGITAFRGGAYSAPGVSWSWGSLEVHDGAIDKVSWSDSLEQDLIDVNPLSPAISVK